MRASVSYALIVVGAILCALTIGTNARAADLNGDSPELCNADAQFAGGLASFLEVADAKPTDDQIKAFVKDEVPAEFQDRAVRVALAAKAMSAKGMTPKQIAVATFNSCLRGTV